jgi:hypothetical protein
MSAPANRVVRDPLSLLCLLEGATKLPHRFRIRENLEGFHEPLKLLPMLLGLLDETKEFALRFPHRYVSHDLHDGLPCGWYRLPQSASVIVSIPESPARCGAIMRLSSW